MKKIWFGGILGGFEDNLGFCLSIRIKTKIVNNEYRIDSLEDNDGYKSGYDKVSVQVVIPFEKTDIYGGFIFGVGDHCGAYISAGLGAGNRNYFGIGLGTHFGRCIGSGVIIPIIYADSNETINSAAPASAIACETAITYGIKIASEKMVGQGLESKIIDISEKLIENSQIIGAVAGIGICSAVLAGTYLLMNNNAKKISWDGAKEAHFDFNEKTNLLKEIYESKDFIASNANVYINSPKSLKKKLKRELKIAKDLLENCKVSINYSE